ncbi:hypothetical protein DC498_23260 [Terrimonas sp.]|nr:hypothetical protein DC498_23260 [Terrimonas sp.]
MNDCIFLYELPVVLNRQFFWEKCAAYSFYITFWVSLQEGKLNLINFNEILISLKNFNMSLNEYKESIKNLVDSINDETLLKHWKHQIEWDIENSDAIELSAEEWSLVQEGIADYKKGDVITLEDFISKRK